VEWGFVDASAIFIDGTHIKASANKKKNTKTEIEISVRNYQEQLDKEIDEDRAAHGKKPLKRDKHDDNNNDGSSGTRETKTVTVSTTYPECGLFHKGSRPLPMMIPCAKCYIWHRRKLCPKGMLRDRTLDCPLSKLGSGH